MLERIASFSASVPLYGIETFPERSPCICLVEVEGYFYFLLRTIAEPLLFTEILVIVSSFAFEVRFAAGQKYFHVSNQQRTPVYLSGDSCLV